MTDEPEVVPIREGVRVQQPRSLALLEMVCQSLSRFEDDEEPSAIAFVIYGREGKVNVGWDTQDEILGERAMCALAGAELLAQATRSDD